MKAADIEIGSKYSVSDHGISRRAEVTEIRVPTHDEHRIHSGARWDFRGHAATQKMARVLFLNHKGEVSESSWVALTNVECSWSAKVKMDEARTRRAQTLNERYSEIEARLSALNIPAVCIARESNHYTNTTVGTARISADSLIKLLDLIDGGGA